MSDFDRINPVIRHYERLAREAHGNDFVKVATSNFFEMQGKYFSSNENPDYISDIRKFCYLYKYTVAHGYYIYSSLKRLRPKIRPSIFSRNPTRIACIGGGPGTEIVGLCRYLREVEAENLQNPVEITIFDKEPSWHESCRQVLACVCSDLNVTLKFVKFDATDKSSFEKIDFSGFHLVMANFFASEIRKARIVQASKAFWKHMFRSMGAGKIFLVLDFADTAGTGWHYVEAIIPQGATVVLSHPKLDMSCPDSKACILDLEAELDHRPKKKATNFEKAIIT